MTVDRGLLMLIITVLRSENHAGPKMHYAPHPIANDRANTVCHVHGELEIGKSKP